MIRCLPCALLAALLAVAPCSTRAADDAVKNKPDPTAQQAAPSTKPAKATKTVEQLVEAAQPSVVVVTHAGRGNRQQGIGTGFVISDDGLIATNFHVIGEARPISVQTVDGKEHKVTEVYASDRKLDLAIIRIDAKGLKPLPLGDADDLKQGQSIVALGNPLGLRHSVVTGVVSARRDMGGVPMIQLAIPIEPGNSGGPMLDLQGRVQGLLTLKSAMTRNLGFATPINALRPLLERPNPVPMDRWLTIGKLDPDQWQTLFGARWRQRAGHIHVEGMGDGFGGRSLCLYQKQPPKQPFEVAVTVRLDDESGAAGLVFASDGDDKHYGFYPSNGRVRLSRFDGPDVFRWKVLVEKPAPPYRAGDWNTIKVRVEKNKVLCYVNDQLVIEHAADGIGDGRVGLAKFRDTVADFKRFRLAKRIAPSRLPDDVVARIIKKVGDLPARGELPADLIGALRPESSTAQRVLIGRAKQLEQQAAQLRRLAAAVHYEYCHQQLAKLLKQQDDDVDLFHAAMLIAYMDNNEIDIDAYRDELDRMVNQVKAKLADNADDKARLAALDEYLFKENGFHGSRTDFYNRANSYLNEVIDDREGIPITLSVLYMELAKRLKVKVVGVGLPGHFVVEYVPKKGQPTLIDVFGGAKPMSRDDAADMVLGVTGLELRDEHLKPTPKRDIVIRMLNNLMRIAYDQESEESTLHYLDAILSIDPSLGRERWARMIVRARTGRPQAALADADWLLKNPPDGIDVLRIEQFRDALQRQMDQQQNRPDREKDPPAR